MQTRRHSAIETLANVLIGYITALASQLLIFPMFGLAVPVRTHLGISAWFTVISLLRSYSMRRWFNRLEATR